MWDLFCNGGTEDPNIRHREHINQFTKRKKESEESKLFLDFQSTRAIATLPHEHMQIHEHKEKNCTHRDRHDCQVISLVSEKLSLKCPHQSGHFWEVSCHGYAGGQRPSVPRHSWLCLGHIARSGGSVVPDLHKAPKIHTETLF